MYGKYRDHSTPLQTDKRRSSRIVLLESSGKRVLKQSRMRLFLLSLVFVLSFSAIGVRLLEIALLHATGQGGGQTLEAYRATKPDHPRADILDRNGEVLATTLETASLYANPKEIRRPVEVAEKLAKILPDIQEKEVARRLSSERSFVWVERHLTPREQKLVNDLGIPGLNFEPEFKRIYPHGSLFSHVLGYVDVDVKGIAGLEKHLNEQLANDHNRARPVELSLDLRVQSILREEMMHAMREFRALGASGIVMNVNNGEVVALSNLPDFDPHRPGGVKDKVRFNRATLGVYEMGSTFKTFTMAMALESGAATMQSGYDASKPIKVARYTIRDSHPKNRWLSLPEVFAYSSNIGTVKMVMDVGTERQQDFMKKLGMFEAVDFELPERASPLLPKPWREINTMTISYGHGISVTPIHLLRGIASIVGEGRLLPVTLLKNGNLNKPEGGKILSAGNVVNIRKLLRMVVEHGTASKADALGYRVGGKTGTAEKLGGGRYQEDAKLASFVGVFPIDDPEYAILVMLDEPKGNDDTFGYATGGWVAAPVVERVVSRIGPLLGVQPIFELPGEETKKPKRWVSYDGGVRAVSF